MHYERLDWLVQREPSTTNMTEGNRHSAFSRHQNRPNLSTEACIFSGIYSKFFHVNASPSSQHKSLWKYMTHTIRNRNWPVYGLTRYRTHIVVLQPSTTIALARATVPPWYKFCRSSRHLQTLHVFHIRPNSNATNLGSYCHWSRWCTNSSRFVLINILYITHKTYIIP